MPNKNLSSPTHTVLVYGTLRPFDNTDIVLVPGYLYNLGWYPGIQLSDNTDRRVVCERITVTEERLQQLDRYEGTSPDNNPEHSLYTRERVGDYGSPERQSWIYVYSNYGKSNPFDNKLLIETGDWQQHTNEKELA